MRRRLCMAAAMVLVVGLAAGCKDTAPPSWPAGAALTAADNAGTRVRLRWPVAQDNKEVKTYRLAGEPLSRPGKHKPGDGWKAEQRVKLEAPGSMRSRSVPGLLEAAKYRFSVQAVDLAGNSSAPLMLELTTRDVTAPVWASGALLTVTTSGLRQGQAEVFFSWREATDNVTVTGFRIKQGDRLVQTVPGDRRGHKLTSKAPDGNWSVEAGDADGNWSEPLRFKLDLTATRAMADVQAAARRQKLANMVAKMGMLKLLGSKGASHDLGANVIGAGPDPSALDRAFSGSGGLSVGRLGVAGRGGRGGGGSSVAVGIGGLGTGGRKGYTGPRIKINAGAEELARFGRRRARKVRRCYLTALKGNPKLAGVLKAHVAADDKGFATVTRVSGVTDAKLLACVRTALVGRTKPGIKGVVSFTFSPTSE